MHTRVGSTLLVVLLLAAHALAFSRVHLSQDLGWRFHLGEVTASQAAASAFDDSGWRALDIPHDFVVEGTFVQSADQGHGFLPPGIGWYRHHFALTAAQRAAAQWTLVFDGVYRDSTVYLNGQRIGAHGSGYTSFRIDLPASVLADDNVLAVRCDARTYEGWWYEGGGIYRHVWLDGVDAVHVAPFTPIVRSTITGTIRAASATAPASADASVAINTTIVNAGTAASSLSLLSTVVGPFPAQTVVATARSDLSLAAGAQSTLVQTVTLAGAQLWSTDFPSLYTVVTQLLRPAAAAAPQLVGRGRRLHLAAAAAVAADVEVDSVRTEFGVRRIEFDVNRGLLLNGVRVKVKGACNHQDFGGVGVAMPDSVHEFRIRKLKEMGTNALRGSHNMQAPEFLTLADHLGLLVWDENRNLVNNAQARDDMRTLVLNDRNHPSVFMWSLCNEGGCNAGSTQGGNLAKEFASIVKSLDPTRVVTAALNGDWFTAGGVKDALDVVGFNYNQGQYDRFHSQFPSTPMTASETSSAVTTRGIYADDNSKGYLSAYDTHAPGWGDTASNSWRQQVSRDFIEGGFFWTGFDYKGEPTPFGWPNINSAFGVIDMVGFPKDNFFYYQTWWRPERAMVHVFPHWTWPGKEGQKINVWVYSAASSVQLFLNNASLGTQRVPANGHVEFNPTYTAGTLRAEAYDANGAVVAASEQRTAGAAVAVRLSLDPLAPQTLLANGQHTTLVTVEVVDAQGISVPTAENNINFAVSGSGALIGVGNGCPSSHEPDKASQRKLFSGLARAVVQAAASTAAGSSVTITASSSGLTAATLSVPVVAPDADPCALGNGGCGDVATTTCAANPSRPANASMLLAVCACRAGFVGFPPVTPCTATSCASVNCGAHGSCSNGACVCKDGYTGAACNIAPSPLPPSPSTGPSPPPPSPSTTICATAAEGQQATLSCPAGKTITAISFASYGLPSGSCPSFTAGSCHASSSVAQVQSTCVGKSSCAVAASNNVFGDPCSGRGKTLDIAATCA